MMGTAARQGARRPELRALTGLRIIAALLVVAHHYLRWWRPGALFLTPGAGPAYTAEIVVTRFLLDGFVGVTFFFVLSGFILAYTYLIPRAGLRTGLRAFYIARFARVYPIYLFATAVALVPYLVWRHGLPGTPDAPVVSPVATIVSAVALVQSWVPSATLAFNSPAWSLSDELLFYATFPLLGVLIARLGRSGLRACAVAMWGVALAILAWQPSGRPGDVLAAIGATPVVHLPEFLLGVAAGMIFLRHQDGQACDEETGRVEGHEHMSDLVVGALAVSIMVLLAAGLRNAELLYPPLLLPLFAGLIYVCAYGVGRLTAALATPLFVLLGEASYAVYILHWPVWEWTTHVLGVPAFASAGSDRQALSLFAAYLVVLVALSVLAHLCIERPARGVIRARLAPRHNAPPTSHTVPADDAVAPSVRTANR